MKKIAIFPGTFDPITNGHVDLIARAAKLFDTVIVAIAENARKAPTFLLPERIDMSVAALAEIPNVTVEGFSNLLMDFARQRQAQFVVRGLRAVSDFEYEFQLANMNRQLAPEIETLFLTPGQQFSFLSSSLVREIVALGGDVSGFVPPTVWALLQNRFNTLRS